MRHFFFVVIVCLLALGACQKNARKANYETALKLAKVEVGGAASINGDIALSKLKVNPRNFSLAIMFQTARECHGCPRIEENFDAVADQYYASVRHEMSQLADPTFNKTGLPKTFGKYRVLFFKMIAEHSYEFARSMEVTGVPTVLYIPPRKKGFPHRPEQFLQFYNYKSFSEEHMLEWIQNFGHIHKAEDTQLIKFSYLNIAIAAAITFAVTWITFPSIIYSRWTWFLFVLATICMTLSGYIANQIHGLEWNGYNLYTGEVVNFMQGSPMHQYKLEGLVITGIVLMGSLSCVCLMTFPHSAVIPYYLKFFFCLFALGGVCLCYNLLAETYGYKMRMAPITPYYVTEYYKYI